MAPNPRISKAFYAMKVFGISEDKVKPVLKRLLKLYDKNWEPIEEENYRVLLDAIFEQEEEDTNVSEASWCKNTDVSELNVCENVDHEETVEDSCDHAELEQPLKRRMKSQGPVGSSFSHADLSLDGPLLKRPKVEGERQGSSSQSSVSERSQPFETGRHQSNSPISYMKGKEPVSPFAASTEIQHTSERASEVLHIEDPTTMVEQGTIILPKSKSTDTLAVITPEDEPFTDDMLGENIVSVVVQHPESSSGNTLTGKPVSHEPLALQNLDNGSRDGEIMPEGSRLSLDIASSPLGEVKISISCSSVPGRPNFHMPNLDEFINSMEEKCLRSYKIVDPSFSFTKLMKDTCECFLELATNPSHESQGVLLNPTPSLELMGKSAQDALGVSDKMIDSCVPSCTSNGSADIQCSAMVPAPPMSFRSDYILCNESNDSQVTKEVIVNDHVKSTEEKESKDLESFNTSSSVVVPQCELNHDELRSIHDVNDITMGEERPESTEEKKSEDLEFINTSSLVVVLQSDPTLDEFRCIHDVNDITMGEESPEDTEEKESNDLESINTSSSVVVPQYEFNHDELRSIHDVNDITMGEERPETTKEKNPEDLEFINTSSLVVVPLRDPTLDELRCIHDVNDITMGEERPEGTQEKESNDLESINTSSLAVVPQCELNHDELRSINDVNDITMGEERLESTEENKSKDLELINTSSIVVMPQCDLTLDESRLIHDVNDITKGDERLVSTEEKKSEDHEVINTCSLMALPQRDCTLDELRSIRDVNDITKGKERLKISWVNEVNNECLPFFHYIPHNLVFENAAVKFSLSQIGDQNCCSCIGDCLSSSASCTCARENGGEFAYTSEGVLKEEVLNERILRTLENQNYLFCNQCPIEKSKKCDMDPCKGHLERMIIKECWIKCGCFMRCANRVVQRGITHKLQVFYTADGKGWGLRTLEKIAKGAFVCEFVGEILTARELFEKKLGNTDPEKHPYPVLLDAFWVSNGVSKDEEALCLDATCYGNIARFINHRCFDANLIEVPVEVETPDRHYYRLAFFTRREIEPFEELTWDYGIQFDENYHLLKAFQCQCGSRFCRNMKHLNSSKSYAAN